MEGDKVLGEVGLADLESHFDSTQLDHIEGDGVNIQCINSSEFVVGRQTNFNGPVTIINCLPDSPSLKKTAESHELEKIVIKDKIMSESAAVTMNKYAEKKLGESVEKIVAEEKKKKWNPPTDFFKVPLCAWIVFLAALVGVVIWFGFVFATPLKKGSGLYEEETASATCQSYNSTEEFCFYSNFDGDGWRSITDIRLPKPAENVVISHTEENDCFALNYCIGLVTSYHNGVNNISQVDFCHFYVGGDGNFYENPSKHLAENSPFNGTINICLMGYFGGIQYPTYPQIKAVKNFLHFGEENNWLAKTYGVLAASTIVNFDEPSSLYDIIKKWKTFKSDVVPVRDSTSSSDAGLIIYHKEDWKGLPAKSFIEMKLPVPYVVISHSVTPECFDEKSCFPRLRSMQSYHFSKDFADIAYNFLVDSSGNVYEGRGWKRRNSQTSFVNGRNIEINFIGDYSADIKPSKNQVEGVKRLIEYGVENGKISKNYSLVAANSTQSTLSPGKNVYAVIKNWPHFDPLPQSHVKEYDDN